jgi:PadR family transcriptional regulator, regulatory protein PadR
MAARAERIFPKDHTQNRRTFFWVDIRPKEAYISGRMTTQPSNDDRIALLQGTLDLLILKTLLLGSCHGQGVARLIQRQSEEVFLVDHGSLYLALQRLEDKKWISAKWGVSENNRKARFYSLTPRGREQLVAKTSEWQRLTRAMGLILDSSKGPLNEEA